MTDKPLSEAAVQTAIRIRAAELGVRPWRNNVGACTDESGRVIRYGLANDSAQLQKRLKSSDLVGWVVLHFPAARPTMGSDQTAVPTRALAVFLSVECKKSDWHGDPSRFNDREAAQQAWIDLVRADGGIAFFARSVQEFEQELRKAGFQC